MISRSVPRHYPQTASKWFACVLDWLYVNVLWGLLGLLISVALTALSNGPFQWPAGLALSLVMLAMTRAATGMEALKEYQAEQGKGPAQWVHRGFGLMLLVGGFLAAVLTPSDIVRFERIDHEGLQTFCAILFFVVMPLSFAAHVLGLKSRDAELKTVYEIAFEKFDNDPEYLQHARAREQRLKDALEADQGAYDGVKL